jgi:uncharacterized protein YidB (DUF937 family)
MGILDDVMGMAGMGSGANAQNPQHAGAMAAVLEYINSPQVGGISGLQRMFQEKGLGGLISSWIGTGQNLPVSSDQLQNVLHGEALQKIAAKLGVDPSQVTSMLSQVLPGIVDKMTPNGAVPGAEAARGLGAAQA